MTGLDIAIGLLGLVAAIGAFLTWINNRRRNRKHKAH
jgi:hypothetical protein